MPPPRPARFRHPALARPRRRLRNDQLRPLPRHQPAPPRSHRRRPPPPRDSLVVSLQGIPDPSNNAVQIEDQGAINLPFLVPINATGVTPSDLSRHIRTTYLERDFYRTVDVSVSVTERYIYVGGEVQRPGRIVWTPDLTLAKAIQAAGGFTL